MEAGPTEVGDLAPSFGLVSDLPNTGRVLDVTSGKAERQNHGDSLRGQMTYTATNIQRCTMCKIGSNNDKVSFLVTDSIRGGFDDGGRHHEGSIGQARPRSRGDQVLGK